jgi:hypothetical protein
MKVLFLDIDGVLNSREYDSGRSWVNGDFFIDETRLPLLKRVVEETGAKIVLSSTRREHWDADPTQCEEEGKYINECLARYGLSIYDKTDILGLFTERKGEIEKWLSEHDDVERFAIVDDFCMMWGRLEKFFVGTDRNEGRGLEERHVQKLIRILNGEGNA